MRKRIIFAVVLVSTILQLPDATAQQTQSVASQSVTLHLEPVIQITAMTSTDVKLGFNTINNYVDGVESGSQQFKIHSNRDYVVSVKTDASSFSYAGDSYPTPLMPVGNTLFLSVGSNNTGGNIANSFSNYTSLSNTPKDLLLNCKQGGDKTFSVNYKANPGPQYPAGEYTVGVVYTATQP